MKTSCTCKICTLMCKNNPCWPTPDEARALIAAGYGDKLMTDWWEDYPSNVKLLCPSVVGFEGSSAPIMPGFGGFIGWTKGRCTLLTDDDLCALHEAGLKPLEGRVATHDMTREDSDDVRKSIVDLWRTEQANFNFAYCGEEW